MGVKAIRASIAVPGIFAPLKIKNDYYVDGGVLNNIPTTILPKRIKKMIIVDVLSYGRLDPTKKVNIKDITEKSILLMMHRLTKFHLTNIPEENYVLIEPRLGRKAMLPRESTFRHIVKEGELAAWRKMPEIKRKLL